MAVSTSVINIQTTPTAVLFMNEHTGIVPSQTCEIVNTSTNIVYWGNQSVTTATGVPIQANGGIIIFDFTQVDQPLFCVASTTAQIRVGYTYADSVAHTLNTQ